VRKYAKMARTVKARVTPSIWRHRRDTTAVACTTRHSAETVRKSRTRATDPFRKLRKDWPTSSASSDSCPRTPFRKHARFMLEITIDSKNERRCRWHRCILLHRMHNQGARIGLQPFWLLLPSPLVSSSEGGVPSHRGRRGSPSASESARVTHPRPAQVKSVRSYAAARAHGPTPFPPLYIPLSPCSFWTRSRLPQKEGP
jgi:hypothetical protein